MALTPLAPAARPARATSAAATTLCAFHFLACGGSVKAMEAVGFGTKASLPLKGGSSPAGGWVGSAACRFAAIAPNGVPRSKATHTPFMAVDDDLCRYPYLRRRRQHVHRLAEPLAADQLGRLLPGVCAEGEGEQPVGSLPGHVPWAAMQRNATPHAPQLELQAGLDRGGKGGLSRRAHALLAALYTTWLGKRLCSAAVSPPYGSTHHARRPPYARQCTCVSMEGTFLASGYCRRTRCPCMAHHDDSRLSLSRPCRRTSLSVPFPLPLHRSPPHPRRVPTRHLSRTLLAFHAAPRQISKLLIIPFVCLVEFIWLRRRFTAPTVLAIVIVVTGVAIV